MITNPLAEIEELVNREILPYESDRLKSLVPKKIKDKFNLTEEGKLDALEDFKKNGPPEIDEDAFIDNDNEVIALLRKMSYEAILNIQSASLSLDSNEFDSFLDKLLSSIDYYKNIVNNSTSNYQHVFEAFLLIEETINNRYLKKHVDTSKINSDLRIKLNLGNDDVRNYFNQLIELNIIDNDNLDLFLHSSFYGFEPKMEVKEKIEVKTTQANLRYFMYRFKEDNRLFEIDQKKFVDLLHNSFACFDGVEQATTYKKMAQRPAKFDLL